MSDANPHDPKFFLFRSVTVMMMLLLCSAAAIYQEWEQSGAWSARTSVVATEIAFFVLCYGWSMHAIYHERQGLMFRLLWIEALLVLCLLVTASELMIATYYISFWIARTPHNYRLRTCVALTAVATLLYLAVGVTRAAEAPFITVLVMLPTYMFVLSVSFTAINERRLRREAVALNQELKAAQELLAQTSRQSERLRIARDMHDMLGHHMTALSLNLEVASHKVEGAARDDIQQAQALARLMLADLRKAVSDLRDNQLDFRQALTLMLARVPQLSITLDLQDDLAIEDPEIAEILLRCIQEAVTNTLRHAQARNCTIRLHRNDRKLVLEISDDGANGAQIVPGNGLNGMRERLQQLAGSLQWFTRDGRFVLQASLPLQGSGA